MFFCTFKRFSSSCFIGWSSSSIHRGDLTPMHSFTSDSIPNPHTVDHQRIPHLYMGHQSHFILYLMLFTLFLCSCTDSSTSTENEVLSQRGGNDSENTSSSQNGMDLSRPNEIEESQQETMDNQQGGVENQNEGEESQQGGQTLENSQENDHENEVPSPLSEIEQNFPPGPPAELYDCRSQNTFDPDLYLAHSPHPLGVECLASHSCNRPLVIGHRGMGGEFGYIAPENSLSAIRAALVIGLDGVELDVLHTQDEGLIVMHDLSFNRTTYSSGLVSETTLEESQTIALRPPPFRARRYQGEPSSIEQGDFSCETIPSLRQALELTRNRLIVDLDLKTDRVDLIVPLLEELDVLDEVYISTAKAEIALQARQLNPQVSIQIRPKTRDAFESQRALFETPPNIFEVPFSLIESISALIDPEQSSFFINVWGTDARVLASNELDLYLEPFEEGAHLMQTEFPISVLTALQRFPLSFDSLVSEP